MFTVNSTLKPLSQEIPTLLYSILLWNFFFLQDVSKILCHWVEVCEKKFSRCCSQTKILPSIPLLLRSWYADCSRSLIAVSPGFPQVWVTSSLDDQSEFLFTNADAIVLAVRLALGAEPCLATPFLLLDVLLSLDKRLCA